MISSRPPFVLVTGGKGGVGKTTVTAQLGVDLARKGKRVLLIDLDLGLANLDIALGVGVGSDIEDALAGRCSIQDCIVKGPGGVDLLPASSGSEHMVRRADDLRRWLLEQIDELADSYDIILGDGAAGIGPDVLGFAAVAQRVLVVTTPEVAAITDAYGLIKALDQHGARLGLDIPTPETFINLASDVEEAKGIGRKLRAMCERFLARSPRDAGWLPRSFRLVGEGACERHPGPLEESCLRHLGDRLQRMIRTERPVLGGRS